MISRGWLRSFVVRLAWTWVLVSPAAAAEGAVLTARPANGPAAIADAVAAAGAGDTVYVSPGTYFERRIEIVKTMFVSGEAGAVIDAGGDGQIFTVRADSVTIRGLELRNVGTSFMEDRAAIKVIDTAGCAIENNVVVNGFFGIYLENSERCTVRGNHIRGEAVREATSGNGIHLWHCRDIVIADNMVRGHRDGIYFEFVESSRIYGNHSENNLRYGLHFMFSHDNRYTGNLFAGNGAGVAVMYSSGVTMDGNRFERNWGGASYGLLLKEIRDSHIRNNYFERNTIAVYSEGSNRVTVEGNSFVGNGYAVKVMANSMENVFAGNNFVGNTFDVTTNSRQNFNTFSGNYWSEYRGYDLDGDGFGDVPYHPVTLFSLLVEREPPGVILMHSLFVGIIDAAERVMPVFTPETLVDEKPLVQALRMTGRG